MKSITTTLALALLGVTAAFASPAFAKKAHHVSQTPAYYNAIPGYNKDGAVVAIPNPDDAGK